MKNKATILVTTDFSTNAKAAIRFALQLATQMPCKLVFYHVLEFMTPLAKHNWLERFFIESKTADMTFNIKIPLLAIRK